MKPQDSSSTTLTIAMVCLAASLSLTACDWVDSAGSENGTSEPLASVAQTEVFLDDTPVGDAIVLNEQGLARITTTRNPSAEVSPAFSWSEEPVEQGNLAACVDQNGFNEELAADTLQQACRSSTQCEFEFEAETSDSDTDQAAFTLRVPTLDASVGLRYLLTTVNDLGETFDSEHTFCLIAINEAPVANDDTFVVTEGTVLNITDTTVNLLTNDSDDTDVSNTTLAVLPEPAEGPMFASFFELGTDGSFTYQTSLSNLREDRFDQFDYQLTDGLFTSVATATIRIVAANQAPQQISAIPPLAATQGAPFSTDLADSFVDPEDGEITFSLSPNTPVATGSGLSISPAGVLSGIPTEADVGSYELIILVSDGGLTTEANVTLAVAAAPILVPNSAPVFVPQTVFSQMVRAGVLMTPIRPVFTDEDGDTLTYAMAGSGILPAGITINTRTGVISGRSSAIGNYTGLRVRATDPSGEFALSSVFALRVVSSQ